MNTRRQEVREGKAAQRTAKGKPETEALTLLRLRDKERGPHRLKDRTEKETSRDTSAGRH